MMRRTCQPALWLCAGVAAGILSWLAGTACFRHAPRLAANPEPAAEQGGPDGENIPASASVRQQRARCLERLGVPPWQAAGQRGQGVKVAILDTGFRGYRSYLGKGLPATVTARSFRLDGQLEARASMHGILCAEIIHTIAPEAELLFANWEADRPDSFLQAVAWARAAGARVVSCSVIMPSWSDGQGGGEVHDALAPLLGAGQQQNDLFFCACAGNTAQRHWTGSAAPNAQGWHCWSPGNPGNGLTPWCDERIAVELYGRELPAGRLEVVDAVSGRVVGAAPVRAGGGAEPAAVRFEPERGADYQVKLHVARPLPSSFHVVVLGGNLTCASPRHSIPFPGDGQCVVTVTAVDSDGERKCYSSCGPTGTRLKPDFAAIVPFPTLLREQPFSGTSAAAPQLAALAALVLSRHPDWSPADVHAFLQRACVDLGAPGADCETGYGLARLPAP